MVPVVVRTSASFVCEDKLDIVKGAESKISDFFPPLYSVEIQNNSIQTFAQMGNDDFNTAPLSWDKPFCGWRFN